MDELKTWMTAHAPWVLEYWLPIVIIGSILGSLFYIIANTIIGETIKRWMTAKPAPATPILPPTAPPPLLLPDLSRLPDAGDAPFGRDQNIAELEAIRRNGARIIAIIAQGGEGKTALLWRWLKQLQGQAWNGAGSVWAWSFYKQGTQTQTSADECIRAALAHFGHDGAIPKDPHECGRLLARVIAEARGLLVLDGLEPLQDADGGKIRDPALDALLRHLAPADAGLILITSRVGVRGPNIANYDLAPLSGADGAELLAHLGVKGSTRALTNAADSFHGHALSLTLLGTYLAETAQGSLANLKRFDVLRADALCGNSHAERVLQAYVDWLPPAPLAILDLIGLFERPASADLMTALRQTPLAGLNEAVHALAEDEWQKQLNVLRRLRLLLPAEADGAIDTHPLIRAFFRRRRAGSAAARAGHHCLFDTLCAQAPDQPDTVEAAQPLLHAIAHGCAAGRSQHTLDEVIWRRLLRGDEFYLVDKLGARASYLESVAPFFPQGWDRPAPELTPADQSFLLNEAGSSLRALGRLGDAEKPLRLSLQRKIEGQDWHNASVASQNLGALLMLRGDLAAAQAEWEAGMDQARQSPRSWALRNQIAFCAQACAVTGAAATAGDLFQQAEDLQKSFDSAPFLYALAGYFYNAFLLDGGDSAAAKRRANANLALSQGNGWLRAQGLDHEILGRAALADQDWPSAADHLDQAVTLLRRAELVDYLAIGLLARAEYRRRIGDLGRAADDLDEADDIARPAGMRLILADLALERARLALAQGQTEPARTFWRQGADLVQECGYHRRDGQVAEIGDKLRAASL